MSCTKMLRYIYQTQDIYFLTSYIVIFWFLPHLLRLWKKSKNNSLRNKCLVYIYIYIHLYIYIKFKESTFGNKKKFIVYFTSEALFVLEVIKF